jgi:hypothetical protein
VEPIILQKLRLSSFSSQSHLSYYGPDFQLGYSVRDPFLAGGGIEPSNSRDLLAKGKREKPPDERE